MTNFASIHSSNNVHSTNEATKLALLNKLEHEHAASTWNQPISTIDKSPIVLELNDISRVTKYKNVTNRPLSGRKKAALDVANRNLIQRTATQVQVELLRGTKSPEPSIITEPSAIDEIKSEKELLHAKSQAWVQKWEGTLAKQTAATLAAKNQRKLAQENQQKLLDLKFDQDMQDHRADALDRARALQIAGSSKGQERASALLQQAVLHERSLQVQHRQLRQSELQKAALEPSGALILPSERVDGTAPLPTPAARPRSGALMTRRKLDQDRTARDAEKLETKIIEKLYAESAAKAYSAHVEKQRAHDLATKQAMRATLDQQLQEQRAFHQKNEMLEAQADLDTADWHAFKREQIQDIQSFNDKRRADKLSMIEKIGQRQATKSRAHEIARSDLVNKAMEARDKLEKARLDDQAAIKAAQEKEFFAFNAIQKQHQELTRRERETLLSEERLRLESEANQEKVFKQNAANEARLASMKLAEFHKRQAGEKRARERAERQEMLSAVSNSLIDRFSESDVVNCFRTLNMYDIPAEKS